MPNNNGSRSILVNSRKHGLMLAPNEIRRWIKTESCKYGQSEDARKCAHRPERTFQFICPRAHDEFAKCFVGKSDKTYTDTNYHLDVLYQYMTFWAPSMLCGNMFCLDNVTIEDCLRFLETIRQEWRTTTILTNHKVDARYIRTIYGRFRLLLLCYGRSDIVGNVAFKAAMKRLNWAEHKSTAPRFFY